MVVQDEASPGATNTFAAEQGVGGEAAEDLDKGIVHECWHFLASLVNRLSSLA